MTANVALSILLPVLWVPTILGCSSSPATISHIESVTVTANQTSASMESLELGNFQWQNRLLLLFAPGVDDLVYREQREQFAAEQARFVERDLLLFELLADGNSRWDEGAIAPDDATTIRSQFNIGPEDFAVVLVGKDGTEKRRDHQLIDPQLIFLEIDAMPMRQREMRQGS